MNRILNSIEEKFLKDNYGILSNVEISQKLDITYKCLRIKIKKLNLVKNEKPIIINERKCPECQKIIIYKEKKSLKNAIKNNSLCDSCCRKGDRNPFYGKKVSKENRKKISDSLKEYYPKVPFKKGIQNNPNPNFYDNWKEKYDKETYDKKVKEYKEKRSIASSGSNNPMYGKPSPQGSGNGWSGWYKGWFFRSLNELSYMVQIIERFSLSWESGEQPKYKIPYIDWEGKERNYFPDFIINGKYIIECKPKRLWQSTNVQSKASAAEAFCKANGMKYKLVECSKLALKSVKKLYDSAEIKFTKRYEEKYIKLNF